MVEGSLQSRLAKIKSVWRKIISGCGQIDNVANCYRVAGDLGRDRGDWAEAIRQYREHLSIAPNDFAIWVQLGHALKESNAKEEAAQAYQAAYEIDPEDADLLLNLGHLHRALGDIGRAADFYRRSFAIDQNDHAFDELQDQSLPGSSPVRRGRNSQRPFLNSGMWRAPPSIVGEIEQIDGWDISGWAVDPEKPEEPAEVAFFADGRCVGTVVACLLRKDIQAEGFGTAVAGFRARLVIDFSCDAEVAVSARLLSSGRELGNSPVKTASPPHLRKWLRRKAETRGDELDLLRHHADEASDGQLLSIIMPIYNTNPEWLKEAITSVRDQWCSRWELICVDDCSPKSETRNVVTGFAMIDSRIKPLFLSKNMGIAAATNAGMKQAVGDYIGFMDHDDYLEPDAVFRMLQTAVRTNADLIYSDEAVTSECIHHINHVVARPSFSHDYYLSHPYFVHFICVKSIIARNVGGLEEKMTISADVDFVLRAIEASENVAHVPAVLYRWRTHGSSAGHTMLDLVTDATVGALNRHIKRLEIDAVAAPGFHFNNHRIDYADDRQRVAIVIPTKDRHDLVKACVDSIRSTTIASEVEIVIIDHDSSDPDSRNYFDEIRSFCTIIPYSGAFNYAKINNFAVNSLNFYHKYIIFMNNDVEVIEAGWLERMRSVAARKEVGVVGATLLYPDRTVQHSGVIMGLGTLADHAHKYIPIGESSARNPGYNGSLTSLRDYTAVTGACMMMRREVFLGVGGFDPKQEIGYNDTDLCLRIGSLGYKVLCDPYAVLYHHESASRRLTNQIDHPDDGMRLAARWAKILEKGDPYYNPLLVHASGMDHRVGDLDNWWHAPRVRPVRPTLRPLSEGTPEAIDAVTRSKCNGL